MPSAASKRICWSGRGRSPFHATAAVAVLAWAAGDAVLSGNPDALGFLMDACRHLKVIGCSGIPLLTAKAGVKDQPGIVALKNSAEFLDLARKGRVWERESPDAF
jgi:hypothetical protein